MSRKRKPVLQLGSGNSKLHKYGYSKEFHAKDKKGKNAIASLIGSYSDSEGEASSEDGETGHVAADVDPATDVLDKRPSAEKEETKAPDNLAKPEDSMDDELKNFLSEIEAIPMPEDGADGKDAVNKGDDDDDDDDKNNSPAQPSDWSESGQSSLVSQAGAAEKAPAKNHYSSMFVKGESEFTHNPSPPPQQVKPTIDKPAKLEEQREVEIPEEPTTHWQLVQDEGSQYYYYWNTLTNEVTWEIPSEYTQFMLLHKEFTDKLAKLPPDVLQAYQDRKNREQSDLAGMQSTAGEEELAVYGPTPAPASTSASLSRNQAAEVSAESSELNRGKKHKKEKKKRRHKRRHSDSEGDSSDTEKPQPKEYGPQLPSNASSNNADKGSSVVEISKTSAGGLLSIVPYDSDANDSDNDDEEDASKVKADLSTRDESLNKSKQNVTLNVVKGGEIYEDHSGISPTAGVDEASSNSGLYGKDSDQVTVKLSKVENNSDTDGPKVGSAEAQSEESSMPPVVKSKKRPKEVIDMFADDYNVPSPKVESEKKAFTNHQEDKSKNDVVCQSSDSQNGESKFSKAQSDARFEEVPQSNLPSHIRKESTKSTKSRSSTNSSSKERLLGHPEKSRPEMGPSQSLNIVGYGTDDEIKEEAKTMAKDEIKTGTLTQLQDASLKTSSPQTLHPASKKKKKEKRHKQDEAREKEEKAEAMGGVLANIVTGHLRREVVAKVTETLDQEISDIVVQTVCQTDSALLKPNGVGVKEADKRSRGGSQDKAAAAGDARAKLKAESQSREDKKLEPASLQEKERTVLNEGTAVKGADNDDDDDIDFEDLDDLDRALEVALEKKKIELAKYEEGERKQQQQQKEDEVVQQVSPAVEATATPAGDAESSGKDKDTTLPDIEEEEKLKAEVKDSAELALAKLEFLDISTDSLSRLQVLLIELQTRLSDWSAGGLSTTYFMGQLRVAQGLLEQYELSAVPQGWACQWDRGNNRYYYRNLSTYRIQWEFPDEAGAETQTLHREDREEEAEGASRAESKVSGAGSNSRSEKSRERGTEQADGGRKKSSSSGRRRRRDERDKDRGSSKYDKRRESSNSSHRYRKKRRRKRDHSSSSSSSSNTGGGTPGATNAVSGNNNNSSSSRRHRHHHKVSKKKKKHRSRSSRSPSVQLIDVSDNEELNTRDVEDKSNPDEVVTVVDVSPQHSSSVSTPKREDGETMISPSAAAQPSSSATAALEAIDGAPSSAVAGADVDGVAMEEDDAEDSGSVSSLKLRQNGGKLRGDEEDEAEDGEREEKEEGEEDEEEEGEATKKAEVSHPAVIYKPPQIVVPPQMLAAVRQPELSSVPQAVISQQATTTAESENTSSQGQAQSAEVDEESEKHSKKKKKEKKLATGSSLLMKKKQMSSMVQKWQKVKKEVEKEDRAKEMRQAAIRKKIEELK